MSRQQTMDHATVRCTLQTALPIEAFKAQILQAIQQHQVVIVTAETGAGKSTQVPQYLLEAGYHLVVTQPRRLAARMVAKRVAQERGERLGDVIGVRTRDDRVESARTRCLFVTDGLALVRELMGIGKHSVLVLDEVHEWNLNVEVLVAWAKRQLAASSSFRVVLMSATLEAQKLAAYFDGAPIIDVPGRLYPVVNRVATDLIDDVAGLLAERRNVLVFQPGKAEIQTTVSDLEQLGVDAEIIPLHGELTAEQQAAAFSLHSRPKCVIATNVAQTSITIDDIDAVVDSGLERRTEVISGVEGLYLRPISLADSAQRRGRAGRTRPGIYIDHCRELSRQEFPKAEILRSRLDQTVLRLAVAGFDAEALEFFHQPAAADIHEAKRALKALALLDHDGTVTPKGRRVAGMPIGVGVACMVIEAERLNVVDDVITAASILEIGDITVSKDEHGQLSYPWRALCAGETESDVLAQMAVFRAASSFKKDDFRKKGVHQKAYFKVRDLRRHIVDALRGKVKEFKSSGRREDILRAVCAGMVDHLFQSSYGEFRGGQQPAVPRQLNRDSIIKSAQLIVGLPWDLEVQTARGTKTLRILRMATKIQPQWLTEIAPHLTEVKTGQYPRYDVLRDSVVSTTEIYFNGQKVSEEVVADPTHQEAQAIFAQWLNGSIFRHYTDDTDPDFVCHNRILVERARELNRRAGDLVFELANRDHVEAWIHARIGMRCCLAELDAESMTLPGLDPKLEAQVLHDFPDHVLIGSATYAVTYDGSRPLIEVLDVAALQAFPDRVLLPGGGIVDVLVGHGYEQARSADVRELRARTKKWIDQTREKPHCGKVTLEQLKDRFNRKR